MEIINSVRSVRIIGFYRELKTYPIGVKMGDTPNTLINLKGNLPKTTPSFPMEHQKINKKFTKMTTQPLKIYERRCHRCDRMYKTTFKFSRVCSKCDKSNNSLFRDRKKIMWGEKE